MTLKSARPPRGYAVSSHLVSVALGTVLALVAAEIVTRCFYNVHYVYDSELGYLHAPGIMRNTGEGPPAVSTWTFDGLRRASPPEGGRAHILALGDSFAEAAMIDDGKVFTDRLEAALPQYQFLNAGHANMSAADYAVFAPVYRRRFTPTWTVIELRVSDLAQDAFDAPHGACYFTLSGQGTLELHSVIIPYKHGFTYWLRERSMLAYFLWLRFSEYRQALSGEKPWFRAAKPSPAPVASKDYPIEAVMDRTAEAYAGRLTFALLAAYLPEAPTEETPDERRVQDHCAARGYSCVSTRTGYQRFADEGRSPFGFSTSSFNEGHMNEAGHALLAEVVAQELRRLHALL
jgi:hypothetical protein